MTPLNRSELVAGEVRAEMARQKKTGKELARYLDVNQATVSRRLTGDVPFDIDELFAVAEWLDVDPVRLFTGASTQAAS